MQSIKDTIYNIFMWCIEIVAEFLYALGGYTRKIFHPYRSKVEFLISHFCLRLLILLAVIITSPFVILGFIFRIRRITDGYWDFVAEIWQPLNWSRYQINHELFKEGID